MTGGRNVLAAALPSAVAEGKVRTGVVFGDGDAPVRWGLADDEARLAALYAVVPHLGSFSATTGADTYRVLRLPGIGVALVSEGASAATWVEGWFAALLHATRFALRASQGSTDLVAHPVVDGTEDTHETPARVLEQLEDECRRILTAAQDQAREIREAAERDARATAKATRASTLRADEERVVRAEDLDRPQDLRDVRREIDAMLGDAERARATLLADAEREADAARRAAELACASLVADTQTTCEALVKDARREAKSSRRHAKKLLRETRAHEVAAQREARRADALGAARRSADDLLHDARRTADDVLHDARRAADDLLRDTTRLRQRLLDDATSRATETGVAQPADAPAAPMRAEGATPMPANAPTAASEEARLATLALIRATAESVAAMSSLLSRVGGAGGAPAGDPFKDLPGLYFGA